MEVPTAMAIIASRAGTALSGSARGHPVAPARPKAIRSVTSDPCCPMTSPEGVGGNSGRV